MIHASTNFSHQISYTKQPNHTLVTSGVYSISRHPSYFGFFWWAIGTQIFLSNSLSTILFLAILWRFFAERITYFPKYTKISREEKLLVKFFGEEYLDYQKRVGTWIPFIQ
jgi:protein-S-isoprenylcysteine O-methyltransferase